MMKRVLCQSEMVREKRCSEKEVIEVWRLYLLRMNETFLDGNENENIGINKLLISKA